MAPAAKAQRLGYEGAYFAWISGTSGDELCPDFFFDDVLTGRPIRNHFNVWQMHISPDIAITVDRYWQATADDEFVADHGAEIVFEVATFLASFAKYVAHRDRYEMIRLLGPDEWHENVDNDAYTNRVSELALAAALRMHAWMSEHHPDRLAALDAGPERVQRWRDVHDKLFVPAADPGTGLIEAFDGFSSLEDTRPDVLRGRLLDPGEYWGWPNGVAVHTQVSKQPAVVQLFAVDPSFPLDVQLANYEFYEPRCAHGSSLSHSVHATVACRLAATRPDLLDQALDSFLDTASLDLNATQHASVGGTFIGGIHTAANAGAYQTAVFGFGGVTVDRACVRIAPSLPPSWTALSFSLIVRGQRLDVTLGHDEHVVTARPDNDAVHRDRRRRPRSERARARWSRAMVTSGRHDVVTASNVREFADDGATVIRGLLDDEWLDLIAEGVEFNRTHPSDWSHWYTAPDEAVGFWSDYVTWPEVEQYRRAAFESPMAGAAARLMRSERSASSTSTSSSRNRAPPSGPRGTTISRTTASTAIRT